jgi:hypothetical protein
LTFPSPRGWHPIPNTLLPYDQPYLKDDDKSSLFGCLATLLGMFLLSALVPDTKVVLLYVFIHAAA